MCFKYKSEYFIKLEYDRINEDGGKNLAYIVLEIMKSYYLSIDY